MNIIQQNRIDVINQITKIIRKEVDKGKEIVLKELIIEVMGSWKCARRTAREYVESAIISSNTKLKDGKIHG